VRCNTGRLQKRSREGGGPGWVEEEGTEEMGMLQGLEEEGAALPEVPENSGEKRRKKKKGVRELRGGQSRAPDVEIQKHGILFSFLKVKNLSCYHEVNL